MKAQEKFQGARMDTGTGHKEKAAHRGTVKHRSWEAVESPVLADWNSLPMEDSPHQLQPQQEPGLDLDMSSLP